MASPRKSRQQRKPTVKQRRRFEAIQDPVQEQSDAIRFVMRVALARKNAGNPFTEDELREVFDSLDLPFPERPKRLSFVEDFDARVGA